MPRLTDFFSADFPDVYAALDRRLNTFTAAPLAIALSGGGDSMALLYVAKAWADRRGRRLLALTVDHGLNADSPAWTAFAGAAARRIGVEWRALSWTGEKPAAGLPAAARAARHRLLAEAARDVGAAVVLLAHNADDVAEGDAMRAGAAPTLGRLRDWSPSPIWPEGRDIFLCRPMLGVRRAALRHWLRAQRRDWLNDPANDDPRFARARIRQALAAAPEHSVLTRLDASNGLSVLASEIEHTEDSLITLPRSALATLDPETARRALSIAVTCAAGASAPPRRDKLDRLASKLQGEPAFIATLNGARLEAGPVAVTFGREPGDLRRSDPAPLLLRAGETKVWDGRFEITADVEMAVQPLAGSATRLSKSDRAALKAIPASVRPALPTLIQGETVSLPRPFGAGPAFARALCSRRFAAASGLITHERDISPIGMARSGWSSYVEALALA